MTLLLSGSEVEQVLRMEEAIDLVEQAFVQFGEGRVAMPQRPVIRPSEYKGLTVFMPAYLPGMGALTVKTVSVRTDNVKKGLPTVIGTVTVLDPATGEALSIMDGAYLTAVRTGAVSGVATKHLAREDAHIVAVFGAGIQARTQLQAVCTVREIDQVRVFDTDRRAAERFASEMGGCGSITDNILVVASPKEALAGADVVVTATSASDPVFNGEDLSLGIHVNGIGSHAPTARELDTEAVSRSKVVCDSVAACLAEAGDLIIPLNEGALQESDIYGELADVISGRLSGRQSDDEITLFKSVGLAIQDASVALHAYQSALEEGLGTEFQFYGGSLY